MPLLVFGVHRVFDRRCGGGPQFADVVPRPGDVRLEVLPPREDLEISLLTTVADQASPFPRDFVDLLCRGELGVCSPEVPDDLGAAIAAKQMFP